MEEMRKNIKNHRDNIKEIFDKLERVGVIGSPSSTTQLSADLLGTAVTKKLVGDLVTFNYIQDGADHYALGQIVEMKMRNVWLEDPTLRSLIRQKGNVVPVTEKQDFHYAVMNVSSVFSVGSETEPSMLGTIPSTGTSIRLMNEDMMRSLLVRLNYNFTFLGNAYGTEIKLPMWFKHFEKGNGGAGEAYHIGIFGKTGSGKSVLSKMIVLGYAKNKKMSIFILDPQGEFTKIKSDSNIQSLTKNVFGKEIEFISLQNLVLSGDELFKNVLVGSPFLVTIGVRHPENRKSAADQIEAILKGKKGHLITAPKKEIKPWEYYKREVFDGVWETMKSESVLSAIYTSPEPRDRVRSNLNTLDPDEIYKLWSKICKLFSYDANPNKRKISDLVKEIIDPEIGKFIIIDLSESNITEDLYWNREIQKVVINELLTKLIKTGDDLYKEDKLLNCLVVLDEAHRLAPREIDKEDEVATDLKTTIVDGALTTRKYGLGWMFISQTISRLDREIIDQIRAYFFGYGLAYGIERQALRDIVGGHEDSLNLYQLFKDPQSGFGRPEYSFMSYGPISPLSFSGAPLFFTTFFFPSDFVKLNFGSNSGAKSDQKV
jgi:hypothetical protein